MERNISQVTATYKRETLYMNAVSSSSPSFLAHCVALVQLGLRLHCEGPDCKVPERKGPSIELEELKAMTCHTGSDCLQEFTGLQCLQGHCECPQLQALNLSSCSCQHTALCSQEPSCHHHNNRKCGDKICSCFSSLNYTTLLLDPATLFCFLPGTSPNSSHTTPKSLTLLSASLFLMLVGLFVYRLSQRSRVNEQIAY